LADSQNKITDQFNAIHKVLSDAAYKTVFEDKLKTLRTELVFHMKKYQATKPKPMSTMKKPTTKNPNEENSSKKESSKKAAFKK